MIKNNIGKTVAATLIGAILTAALGGCSLMRDAQVSQEESMQSADSSAVSQSGSASAPQPVSGALPGVNAENYPRVDASTANMPLLAQMYSTICGVELEEAEAMVSVSGGTGAVWRNMMYEGADILLVYEAPENIKSEMADMGVDFEIEPIGRDGLVFLVNKANPVENLTTGQLRDIYTGTTADWAQVGGESGPISPFQRNEESGSQTLFKKLLMDGMAPMDPPTELIPGSMAGLIEAVASFNGSGGAIGYSVYYYANLMYANPDLKLLSVDGVSPSTESIKSGEYPLVNDFYVVIRSSEPEGSPARLLRDWLLTDAGTDTLTAANYIPIR
jgi:phosphate transport system substrate-binding protein